MIYSCAHNKPIVCPLYKVKWGIFDRSKPTFKMLLATWNFDTFEKRIGAFNAENLESVGKRTAKLLAIKLWEWFDFAWVRTQADWFELGWGRWADLYLRPLTLTASNFAALWPIDPKFSAFKDLIFFSTVIKIQEASSILKVSFAFSKWPHFHRAY